VKTIMESVNIRKCGEAQVSARNVEIRLKPSVNMGRRRRIRVLFINKEELQKVLSGDMSSAKVVRLVM